MDLRHLTDRVSVSGQIAAEDLPALRAAGYTALINNRPAGEAPDQPDPLALAEAATALGFVWTEAPVIGLPTPQQARATAEAADSASGKALAFCRSGFRSAAAWSLGQAQSGAHDPEALVALAEAAGYDLRPLLPALRAARASE